VITRQWQRGVSAECCDVITEGRSVSEFWRSAASTTGQVGEEPTAVRDTELCDTRGAPGPRPLDARCLVWNHAARATHCPFTLVSNIIIQSSLSPKKTRLSVEIINFFMLPHAYLKPSASQPYCTCTEAYGTTCTNTISPHLS